MRHGVPSPQSRSDLTCFAPRPDLLALALIRRDNIPLTPLGLLKMRPDLAANRAANNIIRSYVLANAQNAIRASKADLEDEGDAKDNDGGMLTLAIMSLSDNGFLLV